MEAAGGTCGLAKELVLQERATARASISRAGLRAARVSVKDSGRGAGIPPPKNE